MDVKWTYVNDRFIDKEHAVLHISDLAIQRGYGVFDFIRTVNNVPLYLEDHLERFFYAAEKMRLWINLSSQQLKDIVLELIEKNNISSSGIRFMLTGGYALDGYQITTPNLIISQHLLPYYRNSLSTGIKLVTYDHQREFADVKTINYVMGIWLQPFIKENGADDVLYYKNGMISECPRANFFMVTADNKIVTPSSGILQGIIRKKVLDRARPHFIVEERDVFLEELQLAKEAFITSTTKRVIPVSRINNWSLESNIPGEITQQVSTLLKTAENKYLMYRTV